MGSFFVSGEVASVRRPARKVPVAKLLVDTGSEFSRLPGPLLRRVGVTVAKKDLTFVMANGKTIKRSTGYAILRAESFETIDEVVFGQPGDCNLLGVRTIEGFGVVVDNVGHRFVATTTLVAWARKQ